MKYIFVLISALFLNSIQAALFIEKDSNTRDLEASPILKDLFNILDLPSNITLEEMHEIAQEKLLRPKNKERYECSHSAFEKKREVILDWMDAHGFMSRLEPKNQEYDYVLVHGALTSRLQQRIDFLKQLLETNKIKVKHIVITTGERTLEEYERKQFIEDGYQDVEYESDAARILSDQILRPFLSTGQTLTVINAPQKIKVDSRTGKEIRERPNTIDTVNTWFKQIHPEVGSILAISNNPFILYQDLVLRKELRFKKWFQEGGTLETVGPGVSEEYKQLPYALTVFLDNIARVLYEEKRSFLF